MPRPTHRCISTGEVVFPEGHDAADLEVLPDGYWAEVDRSERVIAHKAATAARIIEVSPEWRQRNDLLALMSGPEHPDYDAASQRWSEIEAIRREANQAEARI